MVGWKVVKSCWSTFVGVLFPGYRGSSVMAQNSRYV
jgi:hypothetical protein